MHQAPSCEHSLSPCCSSWFLEVEEFSTQALSCSKALDEATAMNQQLRAELERLGKDVDQLLTAKGSLASSLDQAKARLEELRRAQAAADARAAVFRDLALRLKRMIDAGDLKIALRSGRMVLVLPNDVLFDSGKTVIKPAGKETLAEVGRALTSFEGRRFQVAGHTDDEPIRFSGFASNWELSAVRALRDHPAAQHRRVRELTREPLNTPRWMRGPTLLSEPVDDRPTFRSAHNRVQHRRTTIIRR